MTPPKVAVKGSLAEVRFQRFDLPHYEMFLRCKALPETRLAYDWQTDTYTITTPARFAPRLDAAAKVPEKAVPLPLADHLFDYQRFIVGRAIDARRYANWSDTGLGKTAVFLEWARQVRHVTGERVLISSPLAIIGQTIAEADRFYRDALPLERIETREQLAAWCKGEWGDAGIGIVNPEKFIAGVLPELRYLGGFVLDESSILKSGGGVIKWNLIKSARGLDYKLSCTATPAPNDAMEYASQASFLERLRTEGEILWTYFTRDKAGNWRVKPHAREAFYAFMASWSIYMRDPSHYGFADILGTLPPPVYHEERLPLTEGQRGEMHRILVKAGAGMLADRIGVRERAKLAQLARGFLYDSDAPTRAVASEKPGRVADIVMEQVDAGRPTLVWTVFDEEAEIIRRELETRRGIRAVRVAALSGATPEKERPAVIEGFRTGDTDVLISKAQMLGYGINFQRCRAMVFSGIDDSFERRYQAVRRAYRFGQTETVHVYTPYIPELEGMMLDNVREKEARFAAEQAEVETCFREAMGVTA